MAMPVTRTTYRHGNVRVDAVNAASDAVSLHGAEALSLRRIADLIGVAHRTIYHHFANREALLDAVAERGFEKLGLELGAASNAAAFIAQYLTFSLGAPHLYALMMSRPHATMKFKPALQAAAHLSIAEAMRHFTKPDDSPQDRRRAVMRVLVLLHGSLSLYGSGILDQPSQAHFIAETQAMLGTGTMESP
ncbi:MAG: helix-turn-helix domain-containing protein [Novosphingobium sp.]|uniref:TetR/AcrR family transcriptional regulator n=1 Tax=Novosphingobium sp. TaxID=1874826 RepID=UPI0032BB26F0